MPPQKGRCFMKFSLSTKPLVTAANLVIINSNVNKFDHKSIMVELTATNTELMLNTETNSILSEVKLMGVGTEAFARAFVDAVIFKQLITSLKTTQVELEFTDGALVVTSGKSSFSLPKLADDKDGAFREPTTLSAESFNTAAVLDVAKWKYIKEHQLYAKAESVAMPVYTYAWVGATGDVLVGDLNNSIFTHSKSGQLDMNCLIKDTIINLFTSLPENTKILRDGDSYALYISSDSYTYRAQITPVIESEENGDYNAETILGIMNVENPIKVDGSEIITILNQSALLTIDKNPKIDMSVNAEGIHLKDKRVNATIAVEGTVDTPYSLSFKPQQLKSLISNCPNNELEICPRLLDGEVVGIIVHTGEYTAVLAGAEE